MKILIVDDSEDAGEILSTLLTFLGHTVRVAQDGQEALLAIEHFTPDVALLDIGLPETDGYQLATQLRDRPALAQTQLVALTGYGSQADRRRSASAGFLAHLLKPVVPNELVAVLDRIMHSGI